MFAVLSLAVIYSRHPDRYNPDRYIFDGFEQLTMGALALPIVNFACCMWAVTYRRYHLVRVYGFLALVWLGLLWWFMMSVAISFHKMGR
jgi:hypothetical protein